MSRYYGSIQIRTEDFEEVRPAVERLARESSLGYFVSPVLEGWVGVYPENSGHNDRDSRELARTLPHDILQVLVHDDLVFSYWYYREGRLIDRFNSLPDYGEPMDEQEKETLRGRPEVFEPLLGTLKKLQQLDILLHEDEYDDLPFAGERLLGFARIFGFENAMTSYDYLTEGHTRGVRGWSEFVHVGEVASERTQGTRGVRVIR